MPKYLVLKGQKNFAAPSAPQNNPYIPEFLLFVAVLRNNISKNTKSFSYPYIPKFLHFIAFLRNSFPKNCQNFPKWRLRQNFRAPCTENLAPNPTNIGDRFSSMGLILGGQPPMPTVKYVPGGGLRGYIKSKICEKPVLRRNRVFVFSMR